MPTYVMLTHLNSEGLATLKDRPGRVKEVNGEVEQLGATVVAQYALLGRYDFVTVLEAPDQETMTRILGEAWGTEDGKLRDAPGHVRGRLHLLAQELKPHPGGHRRQDGGHGGLDEVDAARRRPCSGRPVTSKRPKKLLGL